MYKTEETYLFLDKIVKFFNRNCQFHTHMKFLRWKMYFSRIVFSMWYLLCNGIISIMKKTVV